MAKRRRKKEVIVILCRWMLSFLFSVVLYAVICLYNREKRTVSIPLEVIENSNFEFQSNVPQNVFVDIMGSPSLIYNINPDTIKARMDCRYVEESGIYNVPVELDYNLGVLNSFRIEISPERNSFRIKFGEPETGGLAIYGE